MSNIDDVLRDVLIPYVAPVLLDKVKYTYREPGSVTGNYSHTMRVDPDQEIEIREAMNILYKAAQRVKVALEKEDLLK